MPTELRHPVLKRRKSANTYFVGRRRSGVAEMYAVTTDDVERLSAERDDGGPSADWRDGDTSVIELGRLLLERVVEPPPSPELTTHFALSLLATLPRQGFVLDSNAIWRWVTVSGRGSSRARRVPRPHPLRSVGLLASRLRRRRRHALAQ
jgi:hypothetical protein